jgi:protein disulfide-isomerase
LKQINPNLKLYNKMKKLIIALLLVASVYRAQAQDINWLTNVKEAVAISNKTNKPMLLFFTGSDWCGWCIRLQKEVLKTPEFAAWAEKNVVLVELDYPRNVPQTDVIKIQNQDLQQGFSVQGFPTICFANATNNEGKISFQQIGRTGYVAGGPTAWLAGADEIMKNNPKKALSPSKEKPSKKKIKKNS